MAEIENPYAKYKSQPSVGKNPYAKYKQPEVSTAEDVGKGAVSGLGQGVVGIAGFGGDLQGMMPDASPWLERKTKEYFPNAEAWLRKQSAPYQNFPGTGDLPGSYNLPSSHQIQGQVEKITGPFYQAKTPAGKATQTATSVLPGLALGGETVPGLLVKAAGAGVVSEGAGEAANAIKGHLPSSVQPYAEPVARAVGAVGGTFAPAAIRRAVTPLPMSNEQFGAVNALRARDPNFPMTAGQATESPSLMSLEARSPRMQGVPAQQERAFTGGAMNESGIPSDNFRDIGQGDLVGQRLGALYRSGSISPPEFNTLLRQIGTERRNLIRSAGVGNTPQVDEVRDMVRFGAQNNGTPVLDMPGQRYEFMRGELQRRIDAAGNPQERNALSNIRNHLDTAFSNTVGPGVTEQANNLENQYANYNVLRNVPPQVGRETVSPQEVLSAVGHNWGNSAANTNRGTLAPFAQQAERVMTPLPGSPPEGPLSRVLGAIGGLAIGGGAGHATGGMPGALSEGIVGAILGGERGHDVAQLAKGFTGRVVGSKPVQGYLGNQTWRPGSSTSADPDLIARMLLTPPVTQAGQ
jgi:hypothetical protein